MTTCSRERTPLSARRLLRAPRCSAFSACSSAILREGRGDTTQRGRVWRGGGEVILRERAKRGHGLDMQAAAHAAGWEPREVEREPSPGA